MDFNFSSVKDRKSKISFYDEDKIKTILYKDLNVDLTQIDYQKKVITINSDEVTNISLYKVLEACGRSNQLYSLLKEFEISFLPDEIILDYLKYLTYQIDIFNKLKGFSETPLQILKPRILSDKVIYAILSYGFISKFKYLVIDPYLFLDILKSGKNLSSYQNIEFSDTVTDCQLYSFIDEIKFHKNLKFDSFIIRLKNFEIYSSSELMELESNLEKGFNVEKVILTD